jgi:DNA mismatch repair protein MutS2
VQHVDQQTIEDLEFDVIKLIVHDYCKSDTAKLWAAELAPDGQKERVLPLLRRSKEFQRIRTEGYSFPQIEFDELHKELELLVIPDSVLDAEGFMRIASASALCNDILAFFRDQKDFPELTSIGDDGEITDEIIKFITKVFDHRGLVKDDASPELATIRSEIASVKRKINRNFNKVMKQYREQGWLAETNETFVNDRRVLSVLSTYKRQVSGMVVGSNKTGSWTFIEPQVNTPLNFEMENLIDDEKREIRRIFQQLTRELAGYIDLISLYQHMLVEFDFINAKTRLAIELEADLPGEAEDIRVELYDAYHPILLLANHKEGKTTKPQTLTLDKFSRMLVISGPNAGGKSITLKTVGLLQLMYQSGLLVPATPESKMCFFNAVFTDIGDHQSIENQLSTYSYRLKRMKGFLEKTNRRSLLLLDEFGTGSDPELGGALAEVFFENLYSKKSFGVITTHYANIKLKAADLRNAVNGCMLFDRDSLEPLYELSMGQPGSSFTFEVAEINGIDKELIDKAKSKLDQNKVNLDKLIAELQREKSKVARLNKQSLDATTKAEKAQDDFARRKAKYDDRLKTQQDLVDTNNDVLSKGKKLNQYIKRYTTSKANKDLLQEIKKYLAVEKSKTEDAQKKTKLKEQAKRKRDDKKNRKANQDKIKVGCTVRLITGREKGEVLEVSGGKALVAFGIFKTKVEISKLSYVKD